MLDSIIRELGERTGLGDKAQGLIAQLIALIFDRNQGGFTGFMQRFQSQGLGEVYRSWMGGDSARAQPIAAQDVERALGASTISDLAGKAGIGQGVVGTALASVLPRVVGALTPDGQVPSGVPAGWSSLLGLGGLGTAVSGDESAAGDRVGETAPAAGDRVEAASRGGLAWLKWLVLLLVVLALGYCMLNRRTTSEAPPAAETAPAAPTETAPAPAETAPAAESAATAPPVEPAAQVNSRLSLSVADGKLTYSGQVADDATRTQVVDAIATAFGEGNATGDISVDASTAPARWLTGLPNLLAALKRNGAGATLDIDGDAIRLGGSPSDADKSTLSSGLREWFKDFEFDGLSLPSAKEALGALKAGDFTAEQLIEALNLMSIQFATGKATISQDSHEILQQAADAIKQAPEGTRIEVGGHTDNTGNPDANMKLSQARANAVREHLIRQGVNGNALTAKGYGDTQPVGDNATEQGRAKNRRMQFSVL